MVAAAIIALLLCYCSCSAHAFCRPSLLGRQQQRCRVTAVSSWLDNLFGGISNSSSSNAATEQQTGAEWSTTIVSSGLDSVLSQATYALNEAIASQSAAESGGRRRLMLSVDVLTPGLSPRLEQKAAILQENLFDSVIHALLPAVTSHYKRTMLCFQSIGDAASFQKHVTKNRIDIGRDGNIVLGDVDAERVTSDIDCCLFVTTRQHIGDPVLKEVMSIGEEHPRLDMIFYNCDLSDKVATGIQARASRDSYRATIKPAYYFRNLVEISRPTLVPYEVGALVYTPREGWGVYVAMADDVPGPGSLNRFMRQGVFKRAQEDPSAARPPRFVKVGSFPDKPRGEQLERCIVRGEYLQRKRL